MSTILKPQILKYFPRHKTPGVIPYVPLEEYGRLDRDPVPLWESTVHTIDLRSLRCVITPPQLDRLFIHIQNCVDAEKFPEGIQTRYQKWFTDIFPHSRRDAVLYENTPDIELIMTLWPSAAQSQCFEFSARGFGEMDLISFLSKNDYTGHVKWVRDPLILASLTEEQKQVIAPNGSLPHYILRKSSCYYLLTPKLTYTLFSEDIYGYAVPPLNIWKIWFKDMMFTSPHDNVYSEMRDFCYKMDLLLDDPKTPEMQRKYLNDWIQSRLRKA